MREVVQGARVVATPGCSTPETLLRELGAHSATRPGITLSAGILLGDLPFLPAVVSGQLAMRSWHVTGPMRSALEQGRIGYVPLRASDVPSHVAAATDVLLMRVSPPDGRGYCSFGPSGSYTRAALDAASLVIAEVDGALPRTRGDTTVHVSEIDHLVEADTPTCLYHGAPPTPVSDRIAAHVVELLPRDPTLQFGIGAVPEAVTAALAGADLGRISVVGMGSDRLVPLFERGLLTWVGAEPPVVAVELLGTPDLFELADDNPAVEVVSSTRCHDPRWLATRPRLVSVNSAVAIDLGGQVASDAAGQRVISGVGGSFDFFEGAQWSPGGLRVLALTSMTADGRHSRVVADLGPGASVTIPRHSVDVVVTEHGVARLAGRSLAERADALIAVADPSVRDSLAASR